MPQYQPIMATITNVREIATSFPDVVDGSSELSLGYEIRKTGFAWSWKERIDPRKARVPNLNVLAVRCTLEEKEGMLALEPEKFFTEDHYNGFPAILVRLEQVTPAELTGLLARAVALAGAHPRRRTRSKNLINPAINVYVLKHWPDERTIS